MTKRKDSAEKAIRNIRRATRRQYSADDKIRIVLEGLRGESSTAELCRKEGINQNLYYRWSKEFLEVGKKRLAGNTAREANSDEVEALRSEAAHLKEALAEMLLENRLLKKIPSGMGATIDEIPCLGETRDHQSGGTILTAGAANAESSGPPEIGLLQLARERDRDGGDDALEDARPSCSRVWNRLPERVRQSILKLALERPEWSARELAVLYTERHGYFVSESSVYRLLKAHDLITSRTFVLMRAADQFQHPTAALNQLWKTDFTYLKVIGCGWFYLSAVPDDYSRYILAWKLCGGMAAKDVSDTLSLALKNSGLGSVYVRHRPRLLSDNGPSYVSAELRDWLDEHGMGHTRGRPYHSITQDKIARWHRTMKNQVLLENYYLQGELRPVSVSSSITTTLSDTMRA